MKYVKKGNIYRRESWLKEHRDVVWTCLCVFAFYTVVAVSFLLWGVTMNELNEIKMDIHEKYCELLQGQTEIHKTINNILDLIDGMRKEMKSLRTDVDKLIENNNGGKVYGRTA